MQSFFFLKPFKGGPLAALVVILIGIGGFMTYIGFTSDIIPLVVLGMVSSGCGVLLVVARILGVRL